MTDAIPRDYYTYPGDDPSLHAAGGSKHYIEPDYLAMESDDQLPTLSTMGRGRVGVGVYPEVTMDEEGGFAFALVNDETGETTMQSPNLSAGYLWVSQPGHTPVAGEVAHFTVHVKRAGSVSSYTLDIPPGAWGSRIYTVAAPVTRRDSNVYAWSTGDVFYDGRTGWPSKPVPRPNDTIVFESRKDGRVYLSVGHVEAVENDQVVASVLTYIEIPVPYIGPNGEWYVDGKPTGTKAKGDKGDKGTFSEPVYRQVAFGEPLVIKDDDNDPTNMALNFAIPKGEPGAVGRQGIQGPKGLPARFTSGPAGTLPPGSNTEVDVINIDASTNTYQLSVSVAQGQPGIDGKSINIVRGIYSVADLPPFDTTPVNDAYVVKHTGDDMNDLYIRGKEKDPNQASGWTVVDDWQGIPGEDGRDALAVAGDTYRIPWDEMPLVKSRVPDPLNGITYFDFYIPGIAPDDLITGESPIEVTEEDSRFTIQHMRSGVYSGTYPILFPSSLDFGDNFYIAKIQVDSQGHLYNATTEGIRIPDTLATQTDKGLMSPEDKVKLDDLDGIIPTADGTTIVDNDGVWSATQQDLTIPTITIPWIQENFVL